MLNRMLRREDNWKKLLDGYEMVSETPGPPDKKLGGGCFVQTTIYEIACERKKSTANHIWTYPQQ